MRNKSIHTRLVTTYLRQVLLLIAALSISKFSIAQKLEVEVDSYLPFEKIPTSELQKYEKKSFAHYFTQFVVKINNKVKENDYYTTGYLDPMGENGRHYDYAGFLRDRPIYREPRNVSDWSTQDLRDEIIQAYNMGLDGFSWNILSTRRNDNHWERGIKLLEQAEILNNNFKIMIMPDMKSLYRNMNDADAISVMADDIQLLNNYKSAFRLKDGRLVVSPYSTEVKDYSFWSGLKDELKSRGVDIALVALFQGWKNDVQPYLGKNILYGVSDWGWRDPEGNKKWYNEAYAAKSYGLTWMMPVSQGDMRPRRFHYYESGNTENYRITWDVAIKSNSDWVQLVTWNDYSEHSQVNPSENNQWIYVDMGAYYNQWYKTGVKPKIVRDVLYYSHRIHHTDAPYTGHQSQSFHVKGGTDVRNEIELIGFLKSPGTLEIWFNNKLLTSQEVDAGVQIVKAPLPKSQSGTPKFILRRSGTNIIELPSKFSVTDKPSRQDPVYRCGSSAREIGFNDTDKTPEPISKSKISGELKKWHKITFTFEGPMLDEAKVSPQNPFKDYRVDVKFTSPTGKVIKVPGYFAADGNAAETSATSGNKWRAHITPDEVGDWSYQVSFLKGKSVAIDSNSGVSAGYFDGETGTFDVVNTDKTGKDLRAKGRLKYIGERYLQFAETGEFFLKGGPDAPENFLAYEDFDNTPNNGGYRKSWEPHANDFVEGDPIWQGEKGKEIIGAINYLANKGLNVFSFLTFNINGDDKNVYPYISDNNFQNFDVSKLDQWAIIFDHASTKGMYLHFKTQETENELLLDNGNLGVNRKLYYRELIARFGYHLALNWNLGEENNDQTNQQRVGMAQYFYEVDPYKSPIVIHTYPNDQTNIYTPLLGDNSKLTGASIQTSWNNVHSITKEWIEKSAAAGKKWVVANDEQNSPEIGVPNDSYAGYPNLNDIRKNTLWGNLMAGGAGVEYYFGYKLPNSDLTCQDFRSRDKSWDYVKHALSFFKDNIPFWEMRNQNQLASDAWCFAKKGETYALYFQNGSNTGYLDLSGVNKEVTLRWYNPRNGTFVGDKISLTPSSTTSLGLPPTEQSKDWVALIKVINSETGFIPEISIESPFNNDSFFTNSSIPINVKILNLGLNDVEKVVFYANNIKIGESNIEPFSLTWKANLEGSISLSAKLIAKSGKEFTSNLVDINITNSNNCITDFIEKEGMVIIEAESQKSDNWIEDRNISDFTGQGYIIWNGENFYSSPSEENITYKIKINKTGSYRIQLRSRIGLGTSSTDHNDSWLRFKNATLYAEKNAIKAYAKGGFNNPEVANIVPGSINGWFKVYTNQIGKWSWQTSTWDNNSHDVYVEFTESGIYELQISGRSTGHAIDRITLYHSSLSSEIPLNKITEQTLCTDNNKSPQITSILPQNSSKHLSNTPLNISANATDSDGSISKVAFYVGENLIGEDVAAPYEVTWENPVEGMQTIKAIAYDNLGASTSESVTIIVEAPVVDEPETPVINTLEFSVIHDAYLQNGTLYNNTDLRVENGRRDTYLQFDVNGLEAGSTVTKAELKLKVGSDDGNGILRIFKASHNNWTEFDLSDANRPAKEGQLQELNTTFTSPEIFTFDVTEAITGNGKVSFIVSMDAESNDVAFMSKENETAPQLVLTTEKATEENSSPTVNISSPIVNNDYFTNTDINLSANATDSDGSISKVAFFVGENLIGEDVAAPYEVTWENPEEGTRIIKAVAYDNLGASASESVTIIVEAPVVDEPETPVINTFEFSVIHDAYLQNGTLYNNNDLRIENNRRNTYLQFDVSGLEAGTMVTKAELKLKVGSDNGNGNLRVFKGSHNEWTELNLSNANKPAKEEQLQELNAFFTSPEIFTFDVSKAITGNGKVSFVVSMDAESNDVAFMSKENETAPQLILTTEKSSVEPIIIKTDFMLVDAQSNLDIRNVNIDDKIALSELPSDEINFRYDNIDENIGSVVFYMNGEQLRVENVKPYTVFGDKDGNYFSWKPNVGNYTLVAKSYSLGKGTGELLYEETASFEIVHSKTESFSIVHPYDGGEIKTSTEITIEANVPSTSNGRYRDVTVEFFANGKKIGQADQYPYSIKWSTFTKGRHILTAELKKSSGIEIAPKVNVTAVKLNNLLPEIDWINKNNTIYPYTKDIVLETSVTDKDGKIEKVQFFHKDELLGETDKVPFSYKWKAPLPGIYEITVVAFDDDGDKSVSEPLSLTILLPNGKMPPANVDKDGNPIEEINDQEEEKLDNLELSYGPNPSTDYLEIGLEKAVDGIIDITAIDSTGKRTLLLHDDYKSGQQVNLNLDRLKKGLYLIEVRLNNYNNLFKIIKQ